MAGYVDKVLTRDERVLHSGHVSLWSLAVPIGLGFLLLVAFGLGLLFWAYAYIAYKTTEIAITNKRVIVKFGFIRRSTVEINIAKIESIQVHQGVLGRIFDFGTLVIAGAGDPQAPIPGISDPIGFRRAFVEAQEAALARQAGG
ncbi:MAG: PH domain-containing protein [Rubrivivax sp.]